MNTFENVNLKDCKIIGNRRKCTLLDIKGATVYVSYRVYARLIHDNSIKWRVVDIFNPKDGLFYKWIEADIPTMW
jgi:hypothetical protein